MTSFVVTQRIWAVLNYKTTHIVLIKNSTFYVFLNTPEKEIMFLKK